LTILTHITLQDSEHFETLFNLFLSFINGGNYTNKNMHANKAD